MLTAYIVDDEPLARDELKYLLNRSKEVKILGEGDCIEDAEMEVATLKPDIVFVDIELAEDNGLTLAKQLQTFDPSPIVVFATAYDEYALQAFELNALDYVLKPFDEARIQKTLDKIKQLQSLGNKDLSTNPYIKNDRNEKIPILVDDRIILLNYDEILYIESFEKKCLIKTSVQEFKVNDTLVVMEKKLNKAPFLRVHRSYLVNLDHIAEIDPWFNSTYNLIMKDNSKVPVSRTYVKELKKCLGL
ncbi:LytR/AlgR family response regulator transcription factor [Niallia sp. Sow4_A1]|uniref:LytTR family DNA-binding domain-containing protein n=1 Tax=Niallia hominis TaxID=3133173 RepID=A0ABV1F128_9BACI|nr:MULTISPECIES: LytTR family DNA-binding domain-containing protein [Bacillaceae]MCM3364415.1 LytTR family DNA-binding domain-containing protein [Niallia sp. MER TA 168]